MFTNSKPSIPVTVLSAHIMGLGVIRSLGQMGIPVYAALYEKKDMGQRSKYVKECFLLHNPEQFPDKFMDSLIQFGKKRKGSLLIPTDDATLKIVSQNKNPLSEYYRVACSDWPIIERVISKQFTYSLAESLGVPFPKTFVLKTKSDMEHILRQIGFPCILKPFESHKFFDLFNKKMLLIEDRSHLEDDFAHFSEMGIPLLLQEFIPGRNPAGVNYISYSIEGDVKQDFCAQKTRMTCNGLGNPTAVESCESIEEIANYSKLLLKKLKFTGSSCIEYKYDPRDSRYKLMEINGRYNRSILLSLKCGINFPWMEYQYLTGRKVPCRESYKAGIFWIDEFWDLQSNIKNVLSGKINLSSFLKPYVQPHIFAIFSFSDLKPFMKRIMDGFSYLINSFRRRYR